MKETTNYKFKKRELTDVADITTAEDNWDTADTKLKEIETAHAAHLAETATQAHKIANITNLETELDKRLQAGITAGKGLTIREDKGKSAINPTVTLSIADPGGMGQAIMINVFARQGLTHIGEAQYIVYRPYTGAAYVRTVFERNVTIDISSGEAVISHDSSGINRQLYATSFNVIN